MTDESTPEVTPESLRAHAAWLRVEGRDYIADEVESLADLMDRKKARIEFEAREQAAVDLLAEAFRDGQCTGAVIMASWSGLDEGSRNELRRGVRRALEVLATLSPELLDAVLDTPHPAVEELTEAIRESVEYVGVGLLQPVEGWTWYDAMVEYAPDKADRLRAEWERLQNVSENDGDTVN